MKLIQRYISKCYIHIKSRMDVSYETSKYGMANVFFFLSLQMDIAFQIVTPDLYFGTTVTTKTTDISTYDTNDLNSHFR